MSSKLIQAPVGFQSFWYKSTSVHRSSFRLASTRPAQLLAVWLCHVIISVVLGSCCVSCCCCCCAALEAPVSRTYQHRPVWHPAIKPWFISQFTVRCTMLTIYLSLDEPKSSRRARDLIAPNEFYSPNAIVLSEKAFAVNEWTKAERKKLPPNFHQIISAAFEDQSRYSQVWTRGILRPVATFRVKTTRASSAASWASWRCRSASDWEDWRQENRSADLGEEQKQCIPECQCWKRDGHYRNK